MKYKALIFDMDGTLLDTMTGVINAMNKTLEFYGFNIKFTNEDGKHFIGAGSTEFANRALKRAKIEGVDPLIFRTKFVEFYAECQKTGTKPFYDLDKLLNELKKSGYIVGICSNKPQPLLDQITAQMFPNNKFDLIVGQRPGIPCKPDPQMMEIVMDSLKLKPDEILYIGDSEYDYNFAKNSNVDNCIVKYGYGIYTDEFMNHVTYSVDSVSELERMLLEK